MFPSTTLGLASGTTTRWLVVLTVLALAAAPNLPLLVLAGGPAPPGKVWTPAFAAAISTSLLLAGAVAAISFAVGLPLALLSALYRFPGRTWLMLAQALPLLLPSFLPAIGWSNLAARWPWLPAPSGFWGCAFVLGWQAVPLSFFATWVACQNLTASQIDAARLHGGERAVLRQCAQACAPVTILSSLLAGILSLSDPGAPLILGCRSAAVEIRTTFAALYDYELAGRQCLALALIVFLFTAPVVVIGLRRLTATILARQTRPARPYGHRALGWLGLVGLFGSLSAGVLAPALGLCLPAIDNPMWARAWDKVAATAVPTLWFTCGAGGVAVVLATVLALAARRRKHLQALVLGAFIVLLALPPSLSAMGVAMLAAHAPPKLDWLLRSSLTVPLVLGLRLLPVVAVGMIRAVESLSSSWYEAARLHGVRPWRFFSRVILPLILPAIVIAFLVTAVLSASDITTTHLLQPPGRQSLPVAIFTVMANSPEGLVASLCLLYLSIVLITLLVASFIPRWTAARNR